MPQVDYPTLPGATHPAAAAQAAWAASMASEAAQLEGLLTACLSFDNAVRKQAEDAVKQLSNRPDVIPALLQLLQCAADAQVRQLAAVLARKWVVRHWSKLPAEVRSGGQALLLERIVHEPQHSVRRALAGVVASIAHLTVPQQQWPGLLEFLHQACMADSPEHREVGLLLFAALFETIGDHLQQHVPSILSALSAGCTHPSVLVQTAALSVVEPLLPHVTAATVPAFHTLMGSLLQCAQANLAAGHEDLLVTLCQALVEVAESPAPLLQPCLSQVLEMTMTVATNKAFACSTREQALHLLHWMAKYKPKQLSKHKPLMRAVVDALCEMVCEPRPDDYDDAQELPAQKVAAQTLDVLALTLNSQHVFPPVWAFVQAAAGSPDRHRRTAAMMCCAVLAEGCAEPMRKRLPQLLPLLLAALGDAQGDVRGAAAFALGQFSEYLQPDILEHYTAVMPRVFGLLQDADLEVQERACYALDAFCEHLEPSEILPYMPQLVEQLLVVLRSGRPALQEMAMSAVSSIAAAAQQAFQPHAAQMLPVLEHFMRAPSKELLQCRCMAIESAGVIVAALGPSDAVIGPHIPGMLEVVLQGYAATDSPDLRDHSHSMFGHVAKALGEDFAPWLPRVVPLAYESCRADDGALGSEPGSDGGGDGEDEALGSDDGSDGSEGGGGGHFNVRTGVMDEKVSAVSALGSYADACPRAFMPYMSDAMAVLEAMSHYWHDEARGAAYEGLQKAVLAVHKVFPPEPGVAAAQRAAHGSPAQQPAPVALSQQAAAVADVALGVLTSPVDDDVSKPAVAAAAAALGQLLKSLGRGGVAPEHLEAAAQMGAVLLQGKALCQEADEEDEEGDAGDDEELAAEDEELLAAAADLLPALAASMGPDGYAPVFLAMHAQPLLSRLRPQQPIALRAVAAGAAAEVVEALGPRLAQVVPAMLPLLLRELQTEDDINRQNAAYCAGLLVEASPSDAGPHMAALLTGLHNMFRPDEAPGARDNAVGAVGRILCALPGALPLEQALPVFLGALPLQEDLCETTPAVGALCKLLLGEQLQQIQQHVPRIVQVFGDVSVQAAAPARAKVMAAQALAQLTGRYGEQLAPLLAALPAEQQAALQQWAHAT